ncbi:MAG: response regulator [Moraxellaceae bacterium]|nr:response regulator [Pseudobdellovibrionaceae bacterium]
MQTLQKKLILIVDDSLDSQNLLELIFTSHGYNVHRASNGSEALLLLKELSILPDLIMLDAQMPVMDGYQFRIEQSKIDRLKNIPVVVMTGDSDRHMDQNMLEPLGVMIKPLKIQSVMNTLSVYFNPTGS